MKAVLVDLTEEFGELSDAYQQAREMLRLNPNDNHGVRGDAIHFALAVGVPHEAQSIAHDYPDDILVETTYGHMLALLALNRPDQAQAAFAHTLEANPHGPKFLLNPDFLPPESDESFMGVPHGSPLEAFLYSQNLGGLWNSIPVALGGLEENCDVQTVCHPADMRNSQLVGYLDLLDLSDELELSDESVYSHKNITDTVTPDSSLFSMFDEST